MSPTVLAALFEEHIVEASLPEGISIVTRTLPITAGNEAVRP